jgi:DNA mismatch repair protein MutS
MPPAKKSASMEELYINSFSEYTQKYGPKTAILLQVGKFYEMYDSINVETGQCRANVRELVELCGGAPDPKSTDDPKTNRLFWGFPEHSLPKYERILINAGFTVVVINQDRDRLGEVSGRSVGYVSSPGTYMDPECANVQTQGEDRNIVGILVEPFTGERGRPFWYMASSAFDISTGRCVSTESVVAIVDGKPVLDALEPFWSVYPPSELVVWTLDVSRRLQLNEETAASWFTGLHDGRGGAPVHVYAITESESAAATRGRREFLSRIFKINSALTITEFLDLERHPFALQCLARLLEFVHDHNQSFLAGLRDHALWAPEDELLLGNSALEQLAMLPAGKRSSECLLHWLQKAYSAIGRRALRQRCLKPITDIDELECRQERIAELRLRVSDGTLDRPLRGVHDLGRLFRRFQLGRGSSGDLLQLLSSYEQVIVLIESTRGSLSEIPNIAKMATHVQSVLAAWSAERIRLCITGSPIGLIPAHPWSRQVRPTLDAHEDAWVAISSEVQTFCSTWDKWLSEEGAIKVEWRDDTPFVLTATKRRATAVSTLSKHKGGEEVTMHTKGTASVSSLETARLEELNAKARSLVEVWTEEAQKAWLTEWESFDYCDELIDWIGQLDADYAIARVAEEYGYVKPTYHRVGEDQDTAGLSARDLRHPILERVLQTSYVPHSLELGCLCGTQTEVAHAELGMLLYGVNAAGKSSLSKAVGLAVLMAQCGLPVAASEFHIAPYQALFTRILGNDNMWAGMSSFVVEMTEFRSILRSAGPRTLVLGDELCAGTETCSAIAIVSAGIQTLVGRRTQFLFATHLHELMDFAEISGLKSIRPYHLTVLTDPRNGGKLRYDRRLKEGAGSPMYGLEVCRGLDMDPEFLRRAVDIRKRIESMPSIDKASRYNARVAVQVCGVCGSNRQLETHHILPQASANTDGFVGPGLHKNAAGNLVVLCDGCHNRHHRGEIIIRGWIQTTGGRMLDVYEAGAAGPVGPSGP